MLNSIPGDIARRQAVYVPPPFKAPSGIPFLHETDQRALVHIRALLPVSDDTLSMCADVLEGMLHLRRSR